MTEFDDLVSAEVRKGAEVRRGDMEKANQEARVREARERDESREWQTTIDRIRELFAAATARLKQEGAQPFPVLECRAPPMRPAGLDGVNRVVIVGHRWQFELFALDKRCNIYQVRPPRPLMKVDRRSRWSVRVRLFNYLRGRAAEVSRRDRLADKSLLRTGLNPDDLVLWGHSDDRVEFDAATAARTGRLHCFGKADDGAPLLLRDSGPEPLEAFMARATARILMDRGPSAS